VVFWTGSIGVSPGRRSLDGVASSWCPGGALESVPCRGALAGVPLSRSPGGRSCIDTPGWDALRAVPWGWCSGGGSLCVAWRRTAVHGPVEGFLDQTTSSGSPGVPILVVPLKWLIWRAPM
jgi:hypothetical protein